ncbi:uncharacterized protein isoform X3 [Rhodnius prolixus]|uniref:uncharacterized protein isoform X3 n=1 Tax=Rhodnius prolixus TaxID=13249 RepID=UPI003D189B7D
MSFPAIQKTLTLISEIENKIYHRDLRQRIKILLRSVQDSIKEIEFYLQTSQFNSYKNKIKLCISQMLKVIPSLIQLLSDGHHSAFEDITGYMLEKLRWCLMEPMRMFSGGGVEEDTEASGIFVRSIDWAISVIQAGEALDESYKLAIDDLLCQALTIAKLAADQDFNEISSGCRSVLVSLSSVLHCKEISESARRLHRDILLCNLETLYRRVNTAVLRLFLYVMSDSFLPLKSIVVKCVENDKEANNLKKRKASDLEHLISKLDLYLEQIHLLGNFAVACTDNGDTKLRVQCSLASLEFCETHLVPALTAFYLDQRLERRDYLSFLTDEAQKSLKDLHLQVDNIVDTGSFARVVFEDLTDVTRTVREKISDGIFDKRECELFQRRCNKLVQHLLTTDDKYVRQDQTVYQIVKQLLTVLKNQDNHLEVFSPTANDTIWDLDIALELLDHLCQKLNFSAMNHSSVGRISIDRSVTFLDSVRNLSLDVSATRMDKTLAPSNRDCQRLKTKIFMNSASIKEEHYNGGDAPSSLDPYLSRVGDTPMIKSTLYCRTPLKTPRRMKGEHITYELADILSGLSKATNDTLVSLKEDLLVKDLPATSHLQTDNTPRSGGLNSNIARSMNLSETSTSVLSDMYSHDAADRLRDIIFLEEKIAHLKGS